VFEEYYGFTEPPFNLTPDPRFFFYSQSHRRALDDLSNAIARGEGFMLLTGDIGTGKTTLSRTLLDQIGRLTFSALILNPFVTEEELLRTILVDFGVVSRSELRRGGIASSSKQELIEVVNQFLLSLAGIGATALLVIDEAQNLPAATLEQVRVLTNLETDRQKLLQILLVGQLNLLSILKTPAMRPLDQRISRRCTLQALGRAETDAYIQHRLRTAGAPMSLAFPEPTLDLVHRHSGGVPRVINMLCARALELGQQEGAAIILPEFVRAAAEQLGLEPPRRRAGDRRRALMARLAPRFAIAVVAVVMLLVGGYRVARHYNMPWPGVTNRFSAGVPASPPASPAAAPAAAAPAAEPAPVVFYSILVGSFPSRAEAGRAADTLRTAGYLVRDIVQTEGQPVYRVLIGRYAELALARQHADRLSQDPTFKEATIVTER
jgi:general secretion pathway protein A